MQHYFSQKPAAESRPRAFTAELLGVRAEFLTDAGVFSRGEVDFGSRLLIETIAPIVRGRGLDMGCGWGAVGVMLKLLRPEIELVMADVNERAASLAGENARRNGVAAEALISDGYQLVPGSFDFVALNPPIRAGKETVYRLLDGARDRLRPGGRMFAVMRKEQGAPSAREHLSQTYARVEILAKKKGYWIFACAMEV